MDALPYRATIFLRPIGLRGGQLELMERSFAKEADAIFWCQVMCEAEPQATGLWFVAMSKGGRVMTITREAGVFAAFGLIDGLVPENADNFGGVLAEAGLRANPAMLSGEVPDVTGGKLELAGIA